MEYQDRMAGVGMGNYVVDETKRMSAAVKLQRAWDRERSKSDASRERMRRELELIAGRNKPQEEPKKDQNASEDISRRGFLKGLGAAAGMAAIGKASGEEPEKQQGDQSIDKPVTIAIVKIEDQVRKYNLGTRFKTSREALEFIDKVLADKGLSGYTIDIKRGYLNEKLAPASQFAGSDKNKLGTAGQLRGQQRGARAGDLVGESSTKEDVAEVFDGNKETGITHKGGIVTKTAHGIKHTKTNYDDGNGEKGAKRKEGGNKNRYHHTPILDKEVDEDQRLDPKCWKGYRKQGTKMKGGTRVNNCVKVGEGWEEVMSNAVNKLLENFADGKNPGRKGLAKRSGVNTKASVSDLRKTAKNSTGEKARMAHWMANMKAGKAKK
jgi:hypothetical protein